MPLTDKESETLAVRAAVLSGILAALVVLLQAGKPASTILSAAVDLKNKTDQLVVDIVTETQD